MSSQALPVALIEDNPAHAELFSLRLSEIDGLKFAISHYANSRDAIRAFEQAMPEVVFVDYALTGETGIDVIEQIRSRGWTVPTVMLTGQGDEYIAARVTRAGADDYLVKHDLTIEKLVAVFDHVLQLGRQRRIDGKASAELSDRLSLLTPREVEVLDAILDGKTNKQIAATFHRSIKTIKVHRGRIMEKMQAQTPAELAKMVLNARGSADNIN